MRMASMLLYVWRGERRRSEQTRRTKGRGGMKKITVFMCSLILVLGLAGAAGAVPMTWEDSIDWNPDLSVPPSRTYIHDITDNGFDVNDDTIYSYSLSVGLRDDGGRCDGWELGFVNQPGILGDGLYTFNYSNKDFGWSFEGLYSLNEYGKLKVSISSWYGDFFLDWSKLVARGDNGTAPVPEPATLLLLAARPARALQRARHPMFRLRGLVSVRTRSGVCRLVFGRLSVGHPAERPALPHRMGQVRHPRTSLARVNWPACSSCSRNRRSTIRRRCFCNRRD
jgi:hypothetical protein